MHVQEQTCSSSSSFHRRARTAADAQVEGIRFLARPPQHLGLARSPAASARGLRAGAGQASGRGSVGSPRRLCVEARAQRLVARHHLGKVASSADTSAALHADSERHVVGGVRRLQLVEEPQAFLPRERQWAGAPRRATRGGAPSSPRLRFEQDDEPPTVGCSKARAAQLHLERLAHARRHVAWRVASDRRGRRIVRGPDSRDPEYLGEMPHTSLGGVRGATYSAVVAASASGSGSALR